MSSKSSSSSSRPVSAFISSASCLQKSSFLVSPSSSSLSSSSRTCVSTRKYQSDLRVAYKRRPADSSTISLSLSSPSPPSSSTKHTVCTSTGGHHRNEGAEKKSYNPWSNIATTIATLAASFLHLSAASASEIRPFSSNNTSTNFTSRQDTSYTRSTSKTCYASHNNHSAPLAIVTSPKLSISNQTASNHQTIHSNHEHDKLTINERSNAISLSHRVNFVRQRAISLRKSALQLYNRLTTSTTDSHGDDEHDHSDAVSDSLILLLTTLVIIPLTSRFGISPILGFLAAGIALGPNGFALIRDVRTSKALAELGVVFFLFEMGLELSTSKLKSLGADVFGLGTSQFLVTGAIISLVALLSGISTQTAIVVGAGLALSSSAFVLQLLAERGEMGTRYGRAAFGILLFQDLAVVPVLVLTPLLAGSGGAAAVGRAISIASMKAGAALLFIFFMGKNFLQPVFRFVARSKSSEAFIAAILFTVLATSSLTQMLGLSDTLGAFLAGVMLAETKFRHQIEADIKPFRGLLLGLFFITVGFSIDLNLLFSKLGAVISMVTGLLVVKTSVIAVAAVACGLSIGSSLRTGLLLSQGGEFAFVIFGLATRVGVMPTEMTQLMLLVVAISMAMTPLLAEIGRRISSSLEKKRGLIGVRIEDADTADAKDFVMVAGWGRVGVTVSEMLDAKLVRYMAFDMSPTRVIEARDKGLPVFFGDARRPEVLRSAGVERARAVIVTLDDPDQALEAVQNIKREFENVQVFCRARDSKHQKLLQAAGAIAIVPELLEASLLLGGAVLLDYGTPIEEVNALIEEARAEHVEELGISESVTATLASSFKQLVKFQDADVVVSPKKDSSDDDNKNNNGNSKIATEDVYNEMDEGVLESGETTFEETTDRFEEDVRIEPAGDGTKVIQDGDVNDSTSNNNNNNASSSSSESVQTKNMTTITESDSDSVR